MKLILALVRHDPTVILAARDTRGVCVCVCCTHNTTRLIIAGIGLRAGITGAIVNCGHCRVVRYPDVREVNAPYFRSGAHHGEIGTTTGGRWRRKCGTRGGARQRESTLLCVPIESSRTALSIPTERDSFTSKLTVVRDAV